jgi:hypothetical protein
VLPDKIPPLAIYAAVSQGMPARGVGTELVGLLGLDVIGLNWGIIDFGRQNFYFTGAK